MPVRINLDFAAGQREEARELAEIQQGLQRSQEAFALRKEAEIRGVEIPPGIGEIATDRPDILQDYLQRTGADLRASQQELQQLGEEEAELEAEEEKLEQQAVRQKFTEFEDFVNLPTTDDMSRQGINEFISGFGGSILRRDAKISEVKKDLKNAFKVSKTNPQLGMQMFQDIEDNYSDVKSLQPEFERRKAQFKERKAETESALLAEAENALSETIAVMSDEETDQFLREQIKTGDGLQRKVAEDRLKKIRDAASEEAAAPKTFEALIVGRVARGEITAEEGIALLAKRKKAEAKGQASEPTFTKIEGAAFEKFTSEGYSSLTPQEKIIVDRRLADPLFAQATRIIMDDIRLRFKPAPERTQAIFDLYQEMKGQQGTLPHQRTGAPKITDRSKPKPGELLSDRLFKKPLETESVGPARAPGRIIPKKDFELGMTTEQRGRIKEAFTSGMPIEEIARSRNFSVGTIKDIVKGLVPKEVPKGSERILSFSNRDIWKSPAGEHYEVTVEDIE